MNPKEKRLAANMLSDYSASLGNNGCNDWEFPEDWTTEEIQEFCKRYHAWNGDPEEYMPEHLHLPDFAVASFLAYQMITDQ